MKNEFISLYFTPYNVIKLYINTYNVFLNYNLHNYIHIFLRKNEFINHNLQVENKFHNSLIIKSNALN